MARRKRPVAPVSGAVLKDFTDGDVARIRELVAEGMVARHEQRDWERELEALLHCRGRLRGSLVRFMWQLDPHQYSLDDAVAEEIESAVPGSLGSARRVKHCPDCGGLIHGRLHIVGDRYAKGCP